jgi:hypothetical protein
MSAGISSGGLREPAFPFRRAGFCHELIDQDGSACLVKRTRATSRPNKQLHYEVVLLQWCPAWTLPDGNSIPEGWRYPKSEQWGTYGWTYTELAKAREKYDELCSTKASGTYPLAPKGGV